MKNHFAISISTSVAACLAACGGGGGGGAAAALTAVPAVTDSGVFLDSPVQGLHYETTTQHGDTDANGRFQYMPGESVTFSVGNIKLQATTAKSIMTPLDIFGTTNAYDQRVTNMLVLLQSLDADGNASNGITIPASASALAPTGINFDVAPTVFRTNSTLTNFIASSVGVNRTLVSDVDARLHFQTALNTGVGTGKVNIAPVANAGAAQSVVQGVMVRLDGIASNDANGDALTYQWSIVSKPVGSNASLTSTNTVAANFVPDVAGDYLLGLVVSDGVLGSSISIVKVSASPGTGVPSGYALVWSDEFNTSGAQLPDVSKWAYDVSRNSAGWYNGELQYYSSGRTQNAVVQNGGLAITARKESLAGSVGDWGGQSYTSARLYTKGKASWTYGFFDIRAKLPCGTGTWPAIWTLGSTVDIWPDQGEIDIMEQTGWDKSTVLGTIHTLAGFGGAGSTGSTTLPGSCTSFHNYQIKWTADSIAFYVDGVPYRQPYTKPANTSGWPFDKAQYLLLNLAVGGVLGGSVNDATLSSTSMEVDYVRVYQLP